MTDQEPLATAGDFAISVLLGALIGIEREKRKSEEDDTGHVAGLRTFTLLALLGAVAGWLERETSAPWILAAAILGALVIVGYFINAKPGPDDKGLTTEIAAMVVFLLGPHGDARRPGACHWSRRDHRGGARLQAAAAWLRREAGLGRRLCRRADADRDFHRAAASADSSSSTAVTLSFSKEAREKPQEATQRNSAPCSRWFSS